MKIGITCHTSTGGSGILATELGIALAEKGHHVHFVTYEPPFRALGFQENIMSHYLNVVSYPQFRYPPYTMALATKIADVAEEFDIDIWHAHYAIPYAMSAIMAQRMLPDNRRFRLVTTLHGTDITLVGIDPSFYRITRCAMEGSNAVTSVSDWLTQETKREFNLSRPVQTIPNFFNAARFDVSLADRNFLAEPDEKIVMHISNFRPVKRVTDVVRAFKKISDQVRARLVMVGDGPERMLAVGVARQLGIADRIKYLGNYDEIETILPLADLVFQPSEHESFGLVPLEAMVCGVPVLGTRSGGVVEVVDDGTTGFLTEVGDTDAMAARAVEVLTNTELARTLGANGRERAHRLFSRERVVAKYEAVYDAVMAESALTAGGC